MCVRFCRRFGPITLKLPDAKLQLICFNGTCIGKFARSWQLGGDVRTIFVHGRTHEHDQNTIVPKAFETVRKYNRVGMVYTS